MWLVSRGWGLAALVLAAAAIYVLMEWSARSADPAGSPPAATAGGAPPPPAPSPVAPDVERVLAWFRG
ncbi:MAG TPA: hypothetical protein VEW03_11485, partial [Longimicrobiaceae bacterium]|nr:hypothetical protein [Longimicrobiaceae bacterium]